MGVERWRWREKTAAVTVTICEVIANEMLFTMSAFMVRDYHVASNPQNIGYYAGLLAGVYGLPQVLLSYVWGSFSDKIGRRRAILSSLFLSASLTLGLGLCQVRVKGVCTGGVHEYMTD
jgi:MFS family permease